MKLRNYLQESWNYKTFESHAKQTKLSLANKMSANATKNRLNNAKFPNKM